MLDLIRKWIEGGKKPSRLQQHFFLNKINKRPPLTLAL